MPETKLKLKDPGTIHLMALDTSSLFLPFGQPITDYLRGSAGNQNGSRALLKQGAIAFEPALRWNDSITALLRTTGFGELEQEGLAQRSKAVAEPPDPAVPGFLAFNKLDIVSREGKPFKVSHALPSADGALSIPHLSALPLRPRMTFGPAPAPKVKPAPAPVAKPPAPAPAPVAKPPAPAPVAKANPTPSPAPAPPKPPAAQQVPAKTNGQASVQAKTASPMPPPPRPMVTPVTRVTVPQMPSARAVETKPAERPAPKIAPVPAPAAKAPTPITVVRTTAPPMPPARSSAAVSSVEPATVREAPVRQPQPVAKVQPAPPPAPPVVPPAVVAAPVEAPSATPPPSTFEPNLGMGSEAGFFERIPMLLKIGVVILLAIVGLYFAFGKSTSQPEAQAPQSVSMGEQGWRPYEWVTDTGGSRRGRQIQLYRSSAGMSDYQFKFTGQIETKALGWVFRAFDTKNYYAMKIETLRPGVMALTRFAVVDGRESSYSQKPLTVDARPGASYRVQLDVAGPRFTVSIGGEPVEFWTDNRLKTGAVGFMTERDERGASSSVQFSFPKK